MITKWRGSRHLGKISGTLSPTQFHLSLLGSLASLWAWRHLAAKVGTSKRVGGGGQGSTISLKGCGTSVALATGPNDEEESCVTWQIIDYSLPEDDTIVSNHVGL